MGLFLLFDHERVAVSELVAAGAEGASEGRHRFGGSLAGAGFELANIPPPVHLVALVDAGDPLVAVPGYESGMIPLLYPFRYETTFGQFAYRVDPDGTIVWTGPSKVIPNEDFPYAGFPDEFAERLLVARRAALDPTRAEDAIRCGGVFALKELSDAERKRVRELIAENPSLVGNSDELPEEDWTEETMLAAFGRELFAQAPPDAKCINDQCDAEEDDRPGGMEFEELMGLLGDSGVEVAEEDLADMKRGLVRRPSLKTFAFHETTMEDPEPWDDAFVQTIWQVCTRCRSIHVSNQCT